MNETKPCSRCGKNPRTYYSSWCHQCINEDNHKRRKLNATKARICPKCGENPAVDYHPWCLSCLRENQKAHRAKKKNIDRREVLTAMAEMTKLQSELMEMELPEEAQLKLALLFHNLEKALNLVTSKDFINE